MVFYRLSDHYKIDPKNVFIANKSSHEVRKIKKHLLISDVSASFLVLPLKDLNLGPSD